MLRSCNSHHLALPPKSLSLPAKPLSLSRIRLPARKTLRIAASASTSATMYELLSVTESAGPDQIKAAFRRLARKCHPDTCRSESGKEELTRQFIKAREAYRILSDPVLREDYDFRLRCGCSYGGSSRARRAGFGDWESQLEGLRYRIHRRSGSASWGRRMRAANAAAAAAAASA